MLSVLTVLKVKMEIGKNETKFVLKKPSKGYLGSLEI